MPQRQYGGFIPVAVTWQSCAGEVSLSFKILGVFVLNLPMYICLYYRMEYCTIQLSPVSLWSSIFDNLFFLSKTCEECASSAPSCVEPYVVFG